MKLIKKISIHVFLIIISIFFLFPLMFMIRTSLVPENEFFALPPTFGINLEHYKAVLFNSNFPIFLFNSFIISLGVVFIILIMGGMAGYSLARYNFKRKQDILFTVLTTRMGPPVAFALPFYILYIKLNLIDTYLGLIIIYTLFNLAFGIWMSYSFFKKIPKALEESARIDGASRLQVIRKIILPLAAPGLLATGILIFILTWNEYFYAFIMTRTNVKTFPVHLPSFFGAYQIDWGQMFAASTIATLPIIIFGILIRKYLVKGLTFGAID